jgi:1-hydroxycarotenoid 3,4-desaturase
VVVIGAGVAGLVSALSLAARGLDVTVVERAQAPGGKMREVAVGAARLDAGPTVLTMRGVLEEIFAEAGADLADHLTLVRAEVLARHAWGEGQVLDLFAEIERSAEAIGSFAGSAEARGFRRFCADSARMFRTLEGPFIRSAEPSLPGLVKGVGPGGLGDLWAIKPFSTLWGALGDYFKDPRLRQLFGRYATYCGSSPFASPATLMLVAHVEQAGVWLVEGGMHRVAEALAGLARARGATIRYGAEVREVIVEGGAAVGVRLADGERLPAEAVVVNADVNALAAGLLGRATSGAAKPVPPSARSLSALTWSMVAETSGLPLKRHTVLFSKRGRIPAEPTVYVCAMDRGAGSNEAAVEGPERLLVLVNAPATGDVQDFPPAEIERCAERTFALLRRCGLTVNPKEGCSVATTPADFARMFPGTGGALYGRASHGWQASFARPGARTKVPGLYLAGGSAHPGPGVPMAALSGRLAAASLLADLARPASASRSPSRPMAMPGGTSTR